MVSINIGARLGLIGLGVVSCALLSACDPTYEVRLENDLQRRVTVQQKEFGSRRAIPSGQSITYGLDPSLQTMWFRVYDDADDLLGCVVVDLASREHNKPFGVSLSGYGSCEGLE